VSRTALGRDRNFVRDQSMRQRVLRSVAAAGLWVVIAAWFVLDQPRCPVATLLHRPCAGCGMTRAVELLLRGHVRESLAMYPLVLPALAALLLLVASTVSATFSEGSPVPAHRSLLGRAAIALALVVYVLALVVWVARAFGALGGPVDVS
jgi:hypothetical protein